MQEFSQRVCQHVEAFENEQKKKYKMLFQKTEASAGTAYIFFEESQLQLMFHSIVEVTIVVPLFSFVRHFVCMYYSSFCTLPFQRGASSEFPGVLRRSPPTVTVMFLAFYTDIESSRVEQKQQRQDLRHEHHEHDVRSSALKRVQAR